MRKNEPKTPLLALLRSLTAEQRETLAKDAGTSVTYLYALASCQREQCGSGLAMQIEKASEKMCRRTHGVSPIVTMKELASMCPVADA